MKLCEKYQVTMVFSGHEYVARVAEFGGVKYAVSGGAGALLFEAPKEDNAFNHYLVVKVNNDYIDYEFRRVNPPIWTYTFLYAWKNLHGKVRDKRGASICVQSKPSLRRNSASSFRLEQTKWISISVLSSLSACATATAGAMCPMDPPPTKSTVGIGLC